MKVKGTLMSGAGIVKKRKNTIVVTSQSDIFDDFAAMHLSHAAGAASASAAAQAAAASPSAAASAQPRHTRNRSFHTMNRADRDRDSSQWVTSPHSTMPLPPSSHPGNSQTVPASFHALAAGRDYTTSPGPSPPTTYRARLGTGSGVASGKASRRGSDSAKSPAASSRRTSGGTPALGSSRRSSDGPQTAAGPSQSQLISEALERFARHKASESDGLVRQSSLGSASSTAASPLLSPISGPRVLSPLLNASGYASNQPSVTPSVTHSPSQVLRQIGGTPGMSAINNTTPPQLVNPSSYTIASPSSSGMPLLHLRSHTTVASFSADPMDSLASPSHSSATDLASPDAARTRMTFFQAPIHGSSSTSDIAFHLHDQLHSDSPAVRDMNAHAQIGNGRIDSPTPVTRAVSFSTISLSPAPPRDSRDSSCNGDTTTLAQEVIATDAGILIPPPDADALTHAPPPVHGASDDGPSHRLSPIPHDISSLAPLNQVAALGDTVGVSIEPIRSEEGGADVIEEGDEYDDEYYDDDDDVGYTDDESDLLVSDPQVAVLSSAESLAELELVKMSPWSLRFENPKMESIFAKHFASQLSDNFITIHIVVIAQHVALGIIEYATDTTNNIELPIMLYRCIVVAIFIISAIGTYAHKRRTEVAAELEDAQQQPPSPLSPPHAFADDLDDPASHVSQLDLASDRDRRLEAGLEDDAVAGEVDVIATDHSRSSRALSAVSVASKESTASSRDPPTARLYLLKLIVLLNFFQGALMIIFFTIASRADVDVDGVTRNLFTLYAPMAGELATAFSLVLYAFIFVNSGMLLVHAVPLSLLYFFVSLIISASLVSPVGIFMSSLVLQVLFLVLCVWNMYSMERQTRKELILLCTVARDRARGNDLINNMLPPSVVLRLQIMQQRYEQEIAAQEERAQSEENDAATEEEQDVQIEDENGNIVVRRPSHRPSITSHPPLLAALPADSDLLHSTHFYDVYDDVTVLFCYLSSFSDLVSYMAPQSLVKLLNDIYSAFDDSILTFERMYKVEAIAETYMAVSGCPFVNERHAQTVAEFAINMREIIARNTAAYEHTLDMHGRIAHTGEHALHAPLTRQMSGGPSSAAMRRARSPSHAGSFQPHAMLAAGSPSSTSMQPPSESSQSPPVTRPVQVAIQIGIHSGPIAAGIIGTKTISYHLFGDSVNTASRMCSTSAPGRIQCSSATAALLQDEFSLEALGTRPIKGKGMMETFAVHGKSATKNRRRSVMAQPHTGRKSGATPMTLDVPPASAAHPVSLSPRNLLAESPQQEAARHAVDSFESIVALNEHATAHHRASSISPAVPPVIALAAAEMPNKSPAKATQHTARAANGATIELVVMPVAPEEERPSASPPALILPPSSTPPVASLSTPIAASGARRTSSVDHSPASPSPNGGSGGGGGSALQFVAEFPASTWTLRLDEPALEAEFHAGYFAKSRHHLGLILPLLLMINLAYLIAGALTTRREHLKYFLPQTITAQVLLMALWCALRRANQHELVRADASPDGSPVSPRPSVSGATPAGGSLFHRHDQLLIGLCMAGCMICTNMSGLYAHSHSGSNFVSSLEVSLVANFETLVNFNILAIVAIFCSLRLYYRTAWIVVLIVWADLLIVFACSSDSRVRTSIMSLSVVLVCTLLSAAAQYRREYTSRFDFLLERVLVHEKNNLFQLLQNMLPSPRHAHKLMTGEQVIEVQECVTLLYSDIRGFTELSTKMAPQDLCTLLNSFYSAFDEHLDVRGVYKIDTIGDSFVVVGGLAIENSTVEHASAIADFALDMLGEIENVKAMWREIPHANPLIQSVTMRIGVHTGGVIAATVGLIRPKYLLFGRDTLIANRMESDGVPGQIQISQATYDQLAAGNTHLMEPRGVVDLGPNLGQVTTYLLKGRYIDIIRAARERFAHASTAKVEDGALVTAASASSSSSAAAAAAVDQDAADSETSRLLADEERLDSTPRASFFSSPASRPPPTRRPQTLHAHTIHSVDDAQLHQTQSRAAISLAKRIAHVRNLSREAVPYDWDVSYSQPLSPQFSLSGGTGPTGVSTPAAPGRTPNTASSSARNSVLLASGDSRARVAASAEASVVQATSTSTPIIVVDTTGSSDRPSTGPTPTATASVTPRSSIIQAFTAAPPAAAIAPETNTARGAKSLQLPPAAKGSHAASPSGLPPISPQPNPSRALSIGATAAASSIGSSSRGLMVDLPPKRRHSISLTIDREPIDSRSQSLTPQPFGASMHATASHAPDDAHDLPVAWRRDFSAPRLSSEESLPPSLPVLSRPASEISHRRKSSLSLPGGAQPFQRGIALHHRRSSSVLFTPHLSASTGSSTRVLLPTAGGTSSGPSSGGHSRAGSDEPIAPPRSTSFRTRASLTISVPLASQSASGTAAPGGRTISSPPYRQSSPLLSTRMMPRPHSVRRVRTTESPVPIVEETTSGLLKRSASEQTRQQRVHDRAFSAHLDSATVAGIMRARSGSAFSRTDLPTPASRKSPTVRMPRPQLARRHSAVLATTPWYLRPGAQSPVPPTGPHLRDPPPLTCFDDMHVAIKAFRAQHERDLDGRSGAWTNAQLDRAAQYEHALWAHKLQLLATRRAALAAMQPQPEAASPVVSATPASKPVTILLNDERVSAASTIPSATGGATGTSLMAPNALDHLQHSAPLSPVADSSPASMLSLRSLIPSGNTSPNSPYTYIVEHVDQTLALAESEVAAAAAAATATTEAAAGYDEASQVAGDSSHSPPMDPSRLSSTAVSVDSKVRRATSDAQALSGDPSTPLVAPLGMQHSRSASRLLDHLDTLHSITAQVSSPNLTPFVVPNGERTASAPTSASASPIGGPQHVAPPSPRLPPLAELSQASLRRSPQTPAGLPRPRPARIAITSDPLARDDVEVDIFRGLVRTAAAARTPSRPHRGSESRSLEASGSSPHVEPQFHFHTPTPSSRVVSRNLSPMLRERDSSQSSAVRQQIDSRSVSRPMTPLYGATEPTLAVPTTMMSVGAATGRPRSSRSNSATMVAPQLHLTGASFSASRRHSFSGVGRGPAMSTAGAASVSHAPSTNASAARASGSMSIAVGHVSLGNSGHNSSANSTGSSTAISLRRLAPEGGGSGGATSSPTMQVGSGLLIVNPMTGSPQQSAASSVHASPLPQPAAPRAPVALFTQLQAMARARASGSPDGLSSHSFTGPLTGSPSHSNPKATSRRLSGSPGARRSSAFTLSPVGGATAGPPVVNMVARLHGLHSHPPRTPSYGGFEIRFRGANQQQHGSPTPQPQPTASAARHLLSISPVGPHASAAAANSGAATSGHPHTSSSSFRAKMAAASQAAGGLFHLLRAKKDGSSS